MYRILNFVYNIPRENFYVTKFSFINRVVDNRDCLFASCINAGRLYMLDWLYMLQYVPTKAIDVVSIDCVGESVK